MIDFIVNSLLSKFFKRDVTVNAGTLEFAARTSWPAAGAVTAEGAGKLVLGRADTFGKNVKLRLADSGTLALPAAAMMRVGELWLDDEAKPAPSGLYGAVGDTGAKYTRPIFSLVGCGCPISARASSSVNGPHRSLDAARSGRRRRGKPRVYRADGEMINRHDVRFVGSGPLCPCLSDLFACFRLVVSIWLFHEILVRNKS